MFSRKFRLLSRVLPGLRCVCERYIGGIGYFLVYANRVSRLRLSLLADDFRTVLAVKGLLRRALRHALDCCGPFLNNPLLQEGKAWKETSRAWVTLRN